MNLSEGWEKSEIESATKAQLEERLKTLEREGWEIEEKLEEIRDEQKYIETEMEERKQAFCAETSTLQKLLFMVENCGSWREMECVRAALNGDGLCKADRERLNLLGIQFLHQKIL